MTRISKVSKCNFRSADADQSVTAARCPERGQLKSELSALSQLIGNCCPAVGLTDTQTGLSGTFPQNWGKAV
nr:MAG TPA_asm: hypothetical protein [Caudoviricetes sp.]